MNRIHPLLTLAALLVFSLLSVPVAAQPALYPESPERSPPTAAPSADAESDVDDEPRFQLLQPTRVRWGKSYLEYQLKDRQTGEVYREGDFYRVLGHPELGEQFEENMARQTRGYVLGVPMMAVAVPVLVVSVPVVVFSAFFVFLAGMGAGAALLPPAEALWGVAGVVVGGLTFGYGAKLYSARHRYRLALVGQADARRLVEEANARGALFDARGNARLRETPSSFRLSVAPYVRPTLGRTGETGMAGGVGLRMRW
ncbi:hypothetical protein EA187_20070 [Lujinxingia sediminis]|uniref:DUF3592 domain-containing protein n=1 Tax=Lujinxingia sediminis TaxID=2480984 RepID=A0ABY0CMK7_9DELT|nr:hypothetical protein [Lujinxingia sediminis]RVU40408.1 hypothetical protein EA187_20070 [Lujinxingia sediminis]